MVDRTRAYADQHAGSDRRTGEVPREIALEQARRHVIAFERIIASQEVIVAKLEGLGDYKGAEMARTFLETCRHSLSLGQDHLNHLLRSNRDLPRSCR
jgi:hypothetical protein